MTITRNYGYIKSKRDDRDHLIKFTDEHVNAFSRKIGINTNQSNFDLRDIVKLPQALSNIDQGALGSCTANAISFAYAFDEIKQKNKEQFLASRLFIYYNERMMEGTTETDSGAQIRDGIKSINQYGVCDEHHWIYDPTKFAIKPPAELYDEAKLSKSVSYASINLSDDNTKEKIIAHLKRTISSGFPIVFGFTVYESFESYEVATTGIMPMPSPYEQVMGGHAVCAVGYDDSKQSFIVKNSWGSDWGINGYFYMPYDYISNPNLCNEFWVITQVTDPNNIPNFSPNDINPDAQNLNVSPDGGGVVNPLS